MDEVERQCLELLRRRSERSAGGYDWGWDDPGAKGKGKKYGELSQMQSFIDASPSLGLSLDASSRRMREPDKPDADIVCASVRWGIELTELCCPNARRMRRRILRERSLCSDQGSRRCWSTSEIHDELKQLVSAKDKKWDGYRAYEVNCLVIGTKEFDIDHEKAKQAVSSLATLTTRNIDRAYFVLGYRPVFGHVGWELPVSRSTVSL